jgi:hypothetical protein
LIVGTVTDPSDAIAPGARVTATALDRNHQVSITTDSAGAYTIEGVTPAEYELRVEGKGFTTEIRRGIPLTVGQMLQINFEMKMEPAKYEEYLRCVAESPFPLRSKGTDVGSPRGTTYR